MPAPTRKYETHEIINETVVVKYWESYDGVLWTARCVNVDLKSLPKTFTEQNVIDAAGCVGKF